VGDDKPEPQREPAWIGKLARNWRNGVMVVEDGGVIGADFRTFQPPFNIGLHGDLLFLLALARKPVHLGKVSAEPLPLGRA
jgi:hypothetical protein